MQFLRRSCSWRNQSDSVQLPVESRQGLHITTGESLRYCVAACLASMQADILNLVEYAAATTSGLQASRCPSRPMLGTAALLVRFLSLFQQLVCLFTVAGTFTVVSWMSRGG